MDKNINDVYDELCNAFDRLALEDKRKVIINKVNEINFVLKSVTSVEDIGTFDEIYLSEDEYLCYLHSLVYNLENKLGSLLDKLNNV